MLIVFAGPPCAGKSTLAAELARRRNLPVLSMDATRRRILPAAATPAPTAKVAYRAMHLAAELLLAAGASAILDAPYGHQEDREELARIAADADLRLIECRVSPENRCPPFPPARARPGAPGFDGGVGGGDGAGVHVRGGLGRACPAPTGGHGGLVAAGMPRTD